jgi:hypothetical protein
MEWELVKSVKHLKKLCDINGRAEFYIILAGGLCRSGKEIHYDKQEGKFEIYNEIDDSWQIDVTEKQLYTDTNIPEAIEKSAMYFSGYQLWGV